MKNKFLALLLCIVMLVSILPVYAFAEDNLSDWTYNVLSETDKTAEITGYNGTDTELVFPEEIDGYTMVAIADDAFKGKSYIDYPVTKITIPESYKRIGEHSFYYYKNLVDVHLPHNLEYIGMYSFWRSGIYFENEYQCSLRNEYPVLYIGEYCILAEQNLSGLDKIVYCIKPGTKLIAVGAFSWNKSLKGIIIPEGVEYINDAAFFACNFMVSYVIPTTVKEIGHIALASCEYGMYIKIPPTVTNIADDALNDIGRRSIVYGAKGSEAERFANISGAEFVELNDIVYGDVDGDGIVSVNDYASMKSNVLCKIEYKGENEIIGDMNGDCVIDAFDSIQVEMIANGLA